MRVILIAISVALVVYLLVNTSGLLYLSSNDGEFIDKQIEIPILESDIAVAKERKFLATKTSGRYEVFVMFKFPDGFTDKDARKKGLFKIIKEQSERYQIKLVDSKEKEVKLKKIVKPSPLSNPDSIIILLAANVNLKKNTEYSIRYKFPKEIEDILSIQPILYITRRPHPTL